MKRNKLPKLELVKYQSRDGIDNTIIEQLIELRNKSNLFYHSFNVTARTGSQGILTDWESYFKDKNQRIYSFEYGQDYNRKVIASLEFFVDDSQTYNSNNVTWITSIWIEPEFREIGLAKKLVREMFEDRKGSEFHISVCDRNYIAQKFWASVGFVEKLSTQYVLKWEGDNDEND